MPATRLILAAVAALLVLAPAADASPAKRRAVISVQPASPVATDAISARVRIPARAAKDERYAVEVMTPRNGQCTAYLLEPVPRPTRGRAPVIAQLAPNRDGTAVGWCAGRAVVRLMHSTTGADWVPVPGVARSFTIRRNPRFRPAPLGTRVLIDVLPTSTATVTAPGRATRVLGLGGTLGGFIPGLFALNSDYRIVLGTGAGTGWEDMPASANAITVSSLVTDPLCATPAVSTTAGLAPGAVSGLTISRDGAVTSSIFLATDATTLAGCAGPATGTTRLDLVGVLGVKKLADTQLDVTIGGVPVGGGVTGSVGISLHLKINILD
jgi:hypothetical protein